MYNFTGIVLILRASVFYIAFYILGTSINWPQSLDLPAAEIFPLISQNSSAVFSGYYLYLIASILMLPMLIGVLTILKNEDSFQTMLINITAGFIIASVLARALGILRWLFAMPTLAAVYLDANASPVVKEVAALNYAMLDAYAGKIGEHIGVQLLTTGFLILIGVLILRSKQISVWFGWWALLAALLALPFEDLLGLDLGPMLTISGGVTSLWTLGLGIYMLVQARSLNKSSIKNLQVQGF